jgi:hypothetical protein
MRPQSPKDAAFRAVLALARILLPQLGSVF